MIGELASAIPAEGGFYIWVRRALGPFWGYQEGWLSLSASIFDMAIYPAIFVLYLGKFSPALTAGWLGYAWSLAVVVLCCAWNLRGAPAVGEGSVWMFALLLAPFAVFIVLGLWHGFTVHPAVQWPQPVSECRALHRACSWRYVELHGLGQRLHRRPGSRESAAQLPPRHDCLHHSRGRHLHSAHRRHGVRRSVPGGLLRRGLGARRAHRSAARCSVWPSSSAAPSPASACSTPWS